MRLVRQELRRSGYPIHSAKIPLAIRPWRGLQAAASRLVSMPGACDHWLGDDLGTGAHFPYIESNPILHRRKSVETSLDAGDTSVRATWVGPSKPLRIISILLRSSSRAFASRTRQRRNLHRETECLRRGRSDRGMVCAL